MRRRWLARLGLSGHENDYPHALSGGMRQRVSIARAFAGKPGLLLCDEPFSALDEHTGNALRQEFRDLLRETGATSIFITHSIDEALALGERLMVFERPARIAFETKLPAGMSDAERGDVRRPHPSGSLRRDCRLTARVLTSRGCRCRQGKGRSAQKVGAKTMAAQLGKSILRKEDPALLSGRGRYADDLPVPVGTLHAHVVRSPHAHAEIVRIDARRRWRTRASGRSSPARTCASCPIRSWRR